MIGKHVNRLREAHGQFSSQSQKPFLRECLYKETIPENMVDPPKKSGKLWNYFLLFRATLHHISNNIIEQFPHKRILTFNLHNCIPTDGKEEQAIYHWPLKSTQISTLHQKALHKVFPFENDNCCMACLLRKQKDFRNSLCSKL